MIRTLWIGALAASMLGLSIQMLAGSAWSADTVSAPPSSTTPTIASAPSLSTAASGDVVLSGNPRAQACENASKFGDFSGTGIDECTLALGSPLMSDHDMAATYVDRGAVYMQHKQYVLAKADFDAALKLDPNIANAYVDRGGTLIAEKHYADAIADIDRGLALGPDQPERAYFNRADYLKASQLNPNWAPAKAELARFNASGPLPDNP
jgi:tetratricopeptide (TPR) repeat protein